MTTVIGIDLFCKKSYKDIYGRNRFLEGKVYRGVKLREQSKIRAVDELGKFYYIEDVLIVRKHFVYRFKKLNSDKMKFNDDIRKMLDSILVTMKMIGCSVKEDINIRFRKRYMNLTIEKDDKKIFLQIVKYKGNINAQVYIGGAAVAYKSFYFCELSDFKEIYDILIARM